MQYHPDRNPGDTTAEQKFKEVQEAYDTLSDTNKRARHDAGPAPSFHGNVWESFFGNAPPPQQQERGRNIQVNIELTLNDVLNGTSRTVNIPRRLRCSRCDATGHAEHKPCPNCHGSGKTTVKASPFNIYMGCRDCKGSGRAGTANCSECQGQGFTTNGTQDISINIPAGVDTGHTVRVGGYGEPSKTPNGKNGDLNVILIIKEHKIFKRYGSNLSYELPVGYGDLCVGSVVEVPTLTGAVLLTIPPNTQDLTQFRLKGMGLPYFHGGKGDLLVVAKLTLPNKDIVAANRDLFDKLALLEKDYLSKARERLKK